MRYVSHVVHHENNGYLHFLCGVLPPLPISETHTRSMFLKETVADCPNCELLLHLAPINPAPARRLVSVAGFTKR